MGKPRLFGLAFAPFLFGMVAATCAHAQGFTNLVNFNRTNGAGPNMALVPGHAEGYGRR